jgi:hypothetical protein
MSGYRALALSAAEAQKASSDSAGSSSTAPGKSSAVIDLTEDDDILEISNPNVDLKSTSVLKGSKESTQARKSPSLSSALATLDVAAAAINPTLSPSRTAPQNNLQAFFSERAALEKARLERQKQVLGKRSTPSLEDEPHKKSHVLFLSPQS